MVQPGTYRIRNVKGGTYLDESAKNPDTVHGWDNRDNDNQKWEIQDAGNGSFHIKNVGHGRYLSASGARDNTPVKASDNQTEWTFKDQGRGYTIQYQGGNHVVDLDEGNNDNGTRVSLWGYTGAHQQLWELQQIGGGSSGGQQRSDQWSNFPGDGQQQYVGAVPAGTYRVLNVFTNTALDLAGGSANDGTAVVAWSAGTGNNQEWTLESGSNGYRFKNGASGTYLSYANLNQGELLVGKGGPVQPVEWTVTQADQGFQIHPAQNPQLVIDLAEGKKDDGAKICLWDNNNNANQKWNFNRA
ncbi:hypothetical protein FRC04_008113 [Tulasnella sp. 424]|nr:hypothetical protein FRC04_008113 [Tulasnella sp. 424]KAG8974770.1 hypothetical protein FRC05_006931 [Tulasnella sp. 425]